MSDALREQIQASLGNAYTLDRELGGGGMSRVFVAHEEALGRDVVVKVLSPELAQGLSAERFGREIRLAARLQEPHIVPVLAAGTTADGLPYYTMPFVRGESLRARMARGPVPLPEAATILRDVARALGYAHGQGVVHRDIKPENVLLSEGTAVVTDFGIAKALVTARAAEGGHRESRRSEAPPLRDSGFPTPDSLASLTAIGVSLGTPAYMSPEQVAGDPVDARADLYAWGAMAYELLAGRHPFAGKGSAQQLLAAHLAEVPSPVPLRNAGVPGALVDLVLRCLEKEPGKRLASSTELVAALDGIATSQPVPTTRSRPRRLTTRGSIVLAAAALGTVAVAGIVARSRAAAPAAAGAADAIRSVSVLPFGNLGGVSADAYLAHGITDELAVTLARLPDIRVAPRVSARVLQARGLTATDLAGTLGVQGVLTGSVRRSGDRLRVSAELVNASGESVWADQFEENRTDVFAVEDRVTQAIVGALRPRLTGGAIPRPASTRGTSDPEAYDLYLRGRYFWSIRSEDGIRRAIEYFTRAAGRDSDYVLAISGLADAYAVSAFYSYLPPDEGYGRAKALARRALALDSTRAEPHASLGYVALYYDWDWPEAERRFARAVQLDSTYATGFQWYGNYHIAMNHPTEAIGSLLRAQSTDPLNRISVGAVCWGLYMVRRYRDAIAQCGQAIELDSTFALAHLWTGQAAAMLRDTATAFRELDAAARLSGRGAVFVLAEAQARALAGQPALARRLLAELVPPRIRYVPPYELAIVHAALGDQDRAMALLERAYAERSHSIAFLRVDPGLDPVRSDPRFRALLERTNLR